MSKSPSSGDGTRPTTSGGVENIGAGEGLSPNTTGSGEQPSGPAPTEGMASKRKTAESSKHDDSAPFGMTEDLTPETNRDPSAERGSS